MRGKGSRIDRLVSDSFNDKLRVLDEEEESRRIYQPVKATDPILDLLGEEDSEEKSTSKPKSRSNSNLLMWGMVIVFSVGLIGMIYFFYKSLAG